MARKIAWSKEAADDLGALAEYIARDSSFYAATFVQKILAFARSLNKFPNRGRIAPELGDSNIRELLVMGYRMIYNIEKSRISILAIVHGARDLKAFWKKEKRG